MKWILYYDDECGLCTRSEFLVEQWARTSGQPLEVKTLRSSEAKEKRYGNTLTLEADKIYLAENAWFKLLTLAPWYLRWISWMQFIPPCRWIIKLVYLIVVKTRYFWFLRKKS